MTIRSISPLLRRSDLTQAASVRVIPTVTFRVATTGKNLKLSTGANGQKAEADFPFCPRSFDRAVMKTKQVTILRVLQLRREGRGDIIDTKSLLLGNAERPL